MYFWTRAGDEQRTLQGRVVRRSTARMPLGPHSTSRYGTMARKGGSTTTCRAMPCHSHAIPMPTVGRAVLSRRVLRSCHMSLWSLNSSHYLKRGPILMLS